MEQVKNEKQKGDKATKSERRFVLFAYVAIVPIGLVVAYLMFAKPPSAGVFCSISNGCYEADFGSGFGDGKIAFFLPGGARSRWFPLVRKSFGVYDARFLGDDRVQFVVQGGDRFVRDHVTYGRTGPNDVQNHLDAMLRGVDQERGRQNQQEQERQAQEEAAKAVQQAKERQQKIDSLLGQLVNAKDEKSRAELQERLNEEKAMLDAARKAASRPASTTGKPCSCEPNDPLCSCL